MSVLAADAMRATHQRPSGSSRSSKGVEVIRRALSCRSFRRFLPVGRAVFLFRTKKGGALRSRPELFSCTRWSSRRCRI